MGNLSDCWISVSNCTEVSLVTIEQLRMNFGQAQD